MRRQLRLHASYTIFLSSPLMPRLEPDHGCDGRPSHLHHANALLGADDVQAAQFNQRYCTNVQIYLIKLLYLTLPTDAASCCCPRFSEQMLPFTRHITQRYQRTHGHQNSNDVDGKIQETYRLLLSLLLSPYCTFAAPVKSLYATGEGDLKHKIFPTGLLISVYR